MLRIKSVTTSFPVTHDKPPSGASVGDVSVAQSRLYNAARQFGKPVGARIGSDRATFKLASRSRMMISGTVRLPDGTMTFKGTVRDPSSGLRITGGTGRYRGVRGTVTASDGPGDSTLNTYRLTFPPAA